MAEWSFLTNHARALLVIAKDPQARLRDIAVAVDVTERTAFGIVADLTSAGYVVKVREGRRNRYHVQTQRPMPDPISPERHLAIGDVLAVFVDAS